MENRCGVAEAGVAGGACSSLVSPLFFARFSTAFRRRFGVFRVSAAFKRVFSKKLKLKLNVIRNIA